MYTAGTAIDVTYSLSATDDAGIQGASWDIQVEHPDGTVTYVENSDGPTAGVTIGATVPPTSSIEGSFTITYTPATEGLHTLTLGVGTNGDFQKYNKYMINAINADTTANVNVKYP